MKLSKILNILWVAAAINLTACDFLKEEPETSLTKDAIYESESGVRSVLTGCYHALAAFDYRACTLYEMGVNSVYLASKTSQGTVIQSQIGAIAPDNDSYCNKTFASMWSAISRANDLLANIGESPISESVKREVIGEASLIRAIAYFDLVRTFGRMPMVTKPILSFEGSNVPRSSLRAVYAQILADLRVAEKFMPAKLEQKVAGRPNATAAWAFKAKVYLQMASLTADHFDATKERAADRYTNQEQQHFYQCAYDTALLVKNSGVYRLMPTHAELWNNRSKNTDESIFELQFGIAGVAARFTERTLVGVKSVFAPLLGENNNQGRVRASKMLFCEHWARYGNANKVTDLTSNHEPDCDPRINTSYVYYNDYRPDNTSSGTMRIFPNLGNISNAEQIYPFIKKYYYDAYRGTCEHNFIMYRYADLLLVLAEAANELGKTSEAIGYVNEVVNRAADANGNGLRDPSETKPAEWLTTLTQDEVRTELRWERIFELVGEGHEMFDIRRYGVAHMRSIIALSDMWINKVSEPKADGGWGLSGTLNKTEVVYGASATDDFLKHNLFFPYPKKEIQLNNGIDPSDQNLGWENK